MQINQVFLLKSPKKKKKKTGEERGEKERAQSAEAAIHRKGHISAPTAGDSRELGTVTPGTPGPRDALPPRAHQQTHLVLGFPYEARQWPFCPPEPGADLVQKPGLKP